MMVPVSNVYIIPGMTDDPRGILRSKNNGSHAFPRRDKERQQQQASAAAQMRDVRKATGPEHYHSNSNSELLTIAIDRALRRALQK